MHEIKDLLNERPPQARRCCQTCILIKSREASAAKVINVCVVSYLFNINIDRSDTEVLECISLNLTFMGLIQSFTENLREETGTNTFFSPFALFKEAHTYAFTHIVSSMILKTDIHLLLPRFEFITSFYCSMNTVIGPSKHAQQIQISYFHFVVLDISFNVVNWFLCPPPMPGVNFVCLMHLYVHNMCM